jgi:MFS family permease
MAVDTSNVILTSLIGLLLGVSLGIGMPTCMNYFSDTSSVENRGRLSGIALLASGIGIVALSIISINNAIILGIVLAVWRMSGLLIFLVMKSSVKIVPKRNVTYKEILSQRSFILYFVPWTMFSLINYLVAPISPTSTSNIPGSISLVGLVFLGIFAGIGGFLIDSLGRKFVAIFGFVMLGVGSALLGISIKNPYILYFNAIASGTAWGLLLVLFILTIWGDLSYISTSDKFYAIGASPFFLSAFLGVTVGTYILNLLPNSPQLFSFGAFFLFLAVLPLLYAPETLNEKTIMARQFKTYIEKAQKIAQEENLKNDNQDKEETEKADEEAKQVIQESPEYEDAQKLAEKYY